MKLVMVFVVLANATLVYPGDLFVFPFAVPKDLICALSINTKQTKSFNNNLLGCNSQFMGDAAFSYSTPEIEQIIKKLRLPLLRFPGGTVANWYNWETDTFLIKEDDSKPPFGIREKKFGFPDYLRICKTYSITSIQVFNILQDSPEYSARRLSHLKKSGLIVPWIELGNENYLKDQVGNEISSVDAYITKTKNVVAEIKKVDPAIMCAVNAEFREDIPFYKDWTIPLAKEHYYDAVVLHPYALLNNKKKKSLSDEATIRHIVSAYAFLSDKLNRYDIDFGHRPLLISEWGLPLPIDVTLNMLGTLSTADMFFAIIEGWEKGFVQMASFHILFGNFMGLYYHSNGEMVKRPNALLWELLIDAFRDSSIIVGKSDAPMLDENLPAVQARAVVDTDGTIKIFSVNKCPREATISLTIDGKPFNGQYSRTVYREQDPIKIVSYRLTEHPLITENCNGRIALPPFSVSVVGIR